MADVHSALLAVLKTQLPSVVSVDGCVSVNKHVSAVRLGYEGQAVVKSVEKVYINRLYQREILPLSVSPPITKSEVLAQFCERDNLFLVPGVDYPLDNTVIEMEDDMTLVPLLVSQECPFYKGELFIPLVKVD